MFGRSCRTRTQPPRRPAGCGDTRSVFNGLGTRNASASGDPPKGVLATPLITASGRPRRRIPRHPEVKASHNHPLPARPKPWHAEWLRCHGQAAIFPQPAGSPSGGLASAISRAGRRARPIANGTLSTPQDSPPAPQSRRVGPISTPPRHPRPAQSNAAKKNPPNPINTLRQSAPAPRTLAC